MISIIIPSYNEEAHIKNIIQQLQKNDIANLISEIIIVDGNSTDNTIAIAKTEDVKVIVSPNKGRSAQMNHGASVAKENILYFLHADTIPPIGFTNDIEREITLGYSAGCYMLSFDYDNWFLKANCWFTRFDIDMFRFGDQSLFVTKEMFLKVGGFSENHIVLEDQHIIKQLKKICSFKIIKKPVLTSARKYLENGIYKTQGIFFIIYFMYRLGFSQKKLIETYRNLIRQDKL